MIFDVFENCLISKITSTGPDKVLTCINPSKLCVILRNLVRGGGGVFYFNFILMNGMRKEERKKERKKQGRY